MGKASEKSKGGEGHRVEKVVVFCRAVRAGLAEGGIQAVSGVGKMIFAHKALPRLCFLRILFP